MTMTEICLQKTAKDIQKKKLFLKAAANVITTAAAILSGKSQASATAEQIRSYPMNMMLRTAKYARLTVIPRPYTNMRPLNKQIMNQYKEDINNVK